MPSVVASPAPALVLLLLAASIGASQAGVKCGDTPASPSPAPSTPSNATNSSVFRANIIKLLNALPQAAAPTGFALLSRGAGSDQVFVRGLCRGDSAPSEYLASLQVAVRDFGGRCASSRSAAAWYDKCCVTFADTNASVSYEELLGEVLYEYDGNRVSEPDSYERTYYALMKRLGERAASGGGRRNASAMFATGEAVYARSDPKGTMYGLVECMRDLTAAECDRCLQLAVPVLPTCCWGYQGGVVQNFNCRLRIQVYTYYDLALDAPPPAATTPPGPIPRLSSVKESRRSKHVILVVATSVGTLLVLVVALVCVHLRMKRITRGWGAP